MLSCSEWDPREALFLQRNDGQDFAHSDDRHLAQSAQISEQEIVH
jgi:hypothetical protein